MSQEFKGLQVFFDFQDFFADLVSLFNGISTYVGYLMPKPSFKKNSSGTIRPIEDKGVHAFP